MNCPGPRPTAESLTVQPPETVRLWMPRGIQKDVSFFHFKPAGTIYIHMHVCVHVSTHACT